MLLSAATAEDLPCLLALEESSFDSRNRWSAASWQGEIGVPGHLVIVHRSEGHVDAAACFSVTDATCELLRVVVRPESRRHGHARRLLLAGMEWAQAHGARRVMLEVDAHNHPATTLYSSMGWHPLTTRRNYYGTGQHAVVMERLMEGEHDE